jgi:hypothetical protein
LTLIEGTDKGLYLIHLEEKHHEKEYLAIVETRISQLKQVRPERVSFMWKQAN